MSKPDEHSQQNITPFIGFGSEADQAVSDRLMHIATLVAAARGEIKQGSKTWHM